MLGGTVKDKYMLEKMLARIDGHQGWRIYEYEPESDSYDNVGAAPGGTEVEALKNFLKDKLKIPDSNA